MPTSPSLRLPQLTPQWAAECIDRIIPYGVPKNNWDTGNGATRGGCTVFYYFQIMFAHSRPGSILDFSGKNRGTFVYAPRKRSGVLERRPESRDAVREIPSIRPKHSLLARGYACRKSAAVLVKDAIYPTQMDFEVKIPDIFIVQAHAQALVPSGVLGCTPWLQPKTQAFRPGSGASASF